MGVAPSSLLTAMQRLPQAKEFTFNLAQAAASYDLATASVGNVLVLVCAPYNDVAAAGLTSITIQTDDTTPVAILASTLLAALTGGKNLTPLATAFVLKLGKKIRGTIVGVGSAGSLKLEVYFVPLADGATLV